MQRRRLLKLGLASAAVLAVAGGGMALLQPGLQSGRLTAAGRDVFLALGRGVLDGSLPAEPSARSAALQGLVQRIDALIAALPPHAQAELSQLLALLAAAPGRRLLAELDADWPQASVAQLQESLHSMRFSRVSLRRQAYAGLHDIVGAAYFSEPATWTALGYPGPVAI
jgi:hypothetical protein